MAAASLEGSHSPRLSYRLCQAVETVRRGPPGSLPALIGRAKSERLLIQLSRKSAPFPADFGIDAIRGAFVPVEIRAFEGGGFGSSRRDRDARSVRRNSADLASVLGHADRIKPSDEYCAGLLVADGRKSVEPLAAVITPERTAAQHQLLLRFVSQAPCKRLGRMWRCCAACTSVCRHARRARSPFNVVGARPHGGANGRPHRLDAARS